MIFVNSSSTISVKLAAGGFDISHGYDETGNLIQNEWSPCIPNNERFNRNIMHPQYLLDCIATGWGTYWSGIEVKI